ncbi:hypothetical protein Lesp02_06340 [Lentzea sp. NBRC 105346]|uniref:amino acid adenylation domain-containing protein n=1 Tax=Lentzea sp. NBRC 105346 TaxID=3032205 RepID=UPI0024A1E508|nr:amino acid adenylation domain-containing protein [Lentzea sp. NBRC 105346]GLZ28444.1 hypothetical protein Lesp02_06340 [Lentzea sp. NBRC 105346]
MLDVFRSEWKTATPERRRALVANYLDEVLTGWLGGVPTADERDLPLTDLGLDSILLVEIAGRVRAELGVDLAIPEMLDNGSIRVLENAIAENFVTVQASSIASNETGSLLSHGQHALWLLCQMAPESSAFNVAFTARIRHGFVAERFRRAIRDLVARHPALRTTFHHATRTVHAELSPEFTVIDATGWSDERLREAVRADYERPFALDSGPMLRVSVFGLDGDECVVLLTTHHLICDFSSLSQLLEELSALYLGEEPATREKASYDEFVHRRRRYLDSDRACRAREHWHERLAGPLPVTEWPAFGCPDQRGASSVSFRIEPELAEGLRALASAEQATPYMVLVTAFQVLIHRYTGQDDVLVGTPVAGRTDPVFDETVGYFADPVVLRAGLRDEPAFRAQLRQTRRSVAEALEHQDYPFELLVRELAPPRVPGVNPIFQSMFVYHRPRRFPEWISLYVGDETAEPVSWGGLRLTPFPLHQQEGQHDLLIEVVEDGDRLHGVLKYRRSVFSDEAARRAVDHYLTLLRSIVADPDRSVARLTMIDSAGAQSLRQRVDDRPDSVLHRFERALAGHAGRVAVRFRGTELTYRELDRRAGRWAAELVRRGVRPGDRVAVLLEPSLETPVAILAVLKANASYVPLDVQHPPARLRTMLADCAARIVLTKEALADRVSDVDVVRMGDGLPAEGELPAGRPGRDDLIYTIYTSGSTGVPKGVEVAHGTVLTLLDAMAEHVEPDPDAVWTLFASTAFDVSVWELWGALHSGACLVVVPSGAERAPDAFRRLLVEERVTHLNQTPSALHGLAAQVRADGVGGLVLRHTFACGEVLLPELALDSLGWCGTLWNVYGPTEITMFATVHRVRPEDCTGGGVPVGSALSNTLLYVLDAHRQPVPPQVTGELYIGGIGVARGYLNRPSLTAERYLPNPFASGRMYRTGDLARVNADGLLEILGRADNQVKINGFRVELEEVEAALEQEPKVFWSAVVVEGDRADDRRLTACVVPDAADPPSVAELRSSLQRRLPPYMVPASFVFLDELPLNMNRKVDRRALAELVRARRDTRPVALPGLTGTERTVAEIWGRVLMRDEIGASDNFFEIGGNSMLLLQVHRLLKDLPGGAGVAPSELLRHPTVASIAQRLDTDGPEPAGGAGRDRAAMRKAATAQLRRRTR